MYTKFENDYKIIKTLSEVSIKIKKIILKYIRSSLLFESRKDDTVKLDMQITHYQIYSYDLKIVEHFKKYEFAFII